MIDQGQGEPIVLIPGIQGRAEWMRPAIDALSARHRVLSFSLNEPSGSRAPASDPFERWVSTIDAMLDAAGLVRAAVVGVSFGGIVGVHYAAMRPSRVAALVLTSSPSPRWKPTPRVARYIRHPLLAVPGFVVRASQRLAAEIVTAIPTWPARARFTLGYALRAAQSRIDPGAMAGWVNAWMAADITSDCARITAPTLVVTGEPGLDRVVPVASSLEYLELIAGSRAVVLPGTGHVGCVSKAAEFAAIVGEFVGAGPGKITS